MGREETTETWGVENYVGNVGSDSDVGNVGNAGGGLGYSFEKTFGSLTQLAVFHHGWTVGRDASVG